MFFYVLFYCPFRFSIKTNVKLAFNFVNSIPSSILCKLEWVFLHWARLYTITSIHNVTHLLNSRTQIAQRQHIPQPPPKHMISGLIFKFKHVCLNFIHQYHTPWWIMLKFLLKKKSKMLLRVESTCACVGVVDNLASMSAHAFIGQNKIGKLHAGRSVNW